MEMIQSNQTGTEIQLNLFEAIKDLLLVKPIFLIGVFRDYEKKSVNKILL